MDARTYRERLDDELRTRCVHLKTKAAFLGLPGESDVENDIDTAIWWCEQTCEPLGPDGHTADRQGCDGGAGQGRGRPCYEAPFRA